MPALIQGAVQAVKNAFKRPTPKHASQDDATFAALSWQDKLSSMYREYRTEDRLGRIALNRLWFTTALYMQGKQQVRWNEDTQSLDTFEPFAGEDWYTENQFRKDVWANVKSLNSGDLEPAAAPSSDRPEDVAVSQVANSALDVIYEDIEYTRLKTAKHLSMCLYGSGFIFNTFSVSKDFGVSLIPKYKYEDVELPGMSMCAQCGMTSPPDTEACPECSGPMEQTPPETIESKVAEGLEERPKGQNVSFVTTPLEMYARSKVKGGLRYAPYLFWVRRIDRNILLDARPDADIGEGAMGADEDLASYYIDVLSTLAGGPSSSDRSGSPRYYKEVEYAMCWIRAEMFRGDKELLKKFPNGVKFECANGKLIEGTEEDQAMDSCWTHYVYYPNTYSFWGDGMVDCLPIQDQINETNALMIRYLRYCTMSKKLYDQDMINPEWLSNNPEEAWIPANRQLDKKLSDAVYSIDPTQLSQDVARWKDAQYRAGQDMSGAYAASVGQSTGANASYSKQVFEAERAQGRFAPMFDYNYPSQVLWVRQLLTIFRDNQMDERKKAFIDNAGKWSFEMFTGADLSTGSFDIRIPDHDSIPKSRVDKAQGLEMLVQLQPILPMLTQKEKVYVYDFIGLSPEASPDTLQVQRANRNIQKIIKGAQDVTPLLFVDDLVIQIPTVKEFLASEKGDQLGEENPEAFAAIYTYLTAMTQMKMLQDAAMGGAPMPEGQPGQPQPQNQGTPEKPPTQEVAQAPVPEQNKVPMPPLPQGARG